MNGDPYRDSAKPPETPAPRRVPALAWPFIFGWLGYIGLGLAIEPLPTLVHVEQWIAGGFAITGGCATLLAVFRAIDRHDEERKRAAEERQQ